MRSNKLRFIFIVLSIAGLAGCVNTQPTLRQYSADAYINPKQMQVVVDCMMHGDTSRGHVFDMEYNERLCAAFAKEAQAFLLTEGPSAVADVEVAEISLGGHQGRADVVKSAFSGNHLERSSPIEYSLPIVNGKAIAYENMAYPRLGLEVLKALRPSPQAPMVAVNGCCMDNEAIDRLNALSAQTIGPNVDDDKLTLFVTVSGQYNLKKLPDIEADSALFVTSTFKPDARSGGAKHTYWKMNGISLLASALLIDTNGEVLWSAVGGPPVHSGNAFKAASMNPECLARVARNTWERDYSKAVDFSGFKVCEDWD